MIAAGCVVIGVLWAAGPANAASHRWTIQNASNVKLTLVSVTPYEHHRTAFEGRPADGSVLDPGTLGDPTEQHFELEFGAHVQAVLKYRIFDSDNYVEMWIKNALQTPSAPGLPAILSTSCPTRRRRGAAKDDSSDVIVRGHAYAREQARRSWAAHHHRRGPTVARYTVASMATGSYAGSRGGEPSRCAHTP